MLWSCFIVMIVLTAEVLTRAQNPKYVSILTRLENTIPRDNVSYTSWNISEDGVSNRFFVQISSIRGDTPAYATVVGATSASPSTQTRSVWLCMEIWTNTEGQLKTRHQKHEQVAALQQLLDLADAVNSRHFGTVAGVLLNFTHLAPSVVPWQSATVSREIVHRMTRLYSRLNRTFERARFPYKLGITVDYSAWCEQARFPRKVLQLADLVLVDFQGVDTSSANLENFLSSMNNCGSLSHGEVPRVGILLKTSSRQKSTSLRKVGFQGYQEKWASVFSTTTPEGDTNGTNVATAEERKGARLSAPYSSRRRNDNGFSAILFWIVVTIGIFGCICRLTDAFNDDKS